MAFDLKPFKILLPLYMFELNFVAAKNMSKGKQASEYLLATDMKNPSDYYAKEAQGTIYDPSGLFSEFSISNGDLIEKEDFRVSILIQLTINYH